MGGLISGKLKPHHVREGQEALPQEFRPDFFFFHILNLSSTSETLDASTRGLPQPPSSVVKTRPCHVLGPPRCPVLILMLLMTKRESRAACLNDHLAVSIGKHLLLGSVTSRKLWPLLGPPFHKLPGCCQNEVGEWMQVLCRTQTGSRSREAWSRGNREEVKRFASPALFLGLSPCL